MGDQEVVRVGGSLVRRALADAVGTFALVFVGCGAVVVDGLHGGVIGHLGVSAAFGLVVGVMILATGHVSGAHFNPAVTVAFAVIGAFPWREVPAYVIAQLAAAVTAALALAGLIGAGSQLGATVPATGLAPSFGLEVLLTAFLMFVITSVATDARAHGALAGLAIGGTVAMCALVGGPLTGASMNPARSLGPALVAGVAEGQWLYVVAPVLGATLGALGYRFVAEPPTGATGAA